MDIRYSLSRAYFDKKYSISKTTDSKPEAPTTNNSTTTTTQSTDTNTYTFNTKSATKDFATLCKNNAEKINNLTNELKQMILPPNATKDEINEYIAKVYSMLREAGEYQHEVSNFPLQLTHIPEKDLVNQAYRKFSELAYSKINSARQKL